MAFSQCNRVDPFTSRVRTLYGANVLRVPRNGIDPLEVLAVRKRRVETRGRLTGLLDGAGGPELPQPTAYPVADLNGLRSAGLDVELGLKFTASFLSVIGVPVPGAELNTSLWAGTRSIDFEVREVSELRVDLGLLGKALTGRRIDTSPSTAVFLTDPAVRMLVITRTLVSRNFAIRSASDSGQSADISLDAIEDLIGKTTASVKWSRESTDAITFQGDTAVTFAFAAVPCAIQADRSFVFGTEADRLTFGGAVPAPREQAVIDEDGLLDFDEPAGA
jgi:hypothetical protein